MEFDDQAFLDAEHRIGRQIRIVRVEDPAAIARVGFDGPYWETVCDFVLAKA